VSDRALSGRGFVVDFGQGRRVLPGGPARFAIRSGAALIPFYVVLNRESTSKRPYLGFFEAPIAVDRSGIESPEQLTQTMAEAMARVVRRFPDQWFVFQPEWLPPNPEPAVTSPR
jgi:lauroyl/myristoyl acyltransferase